MNLKLNELSNKQIVFYTVGGISLIYGTAWFVNRKVKKYKANKAHDKSFEEGNVETYAKLIKMAFQNDGMPGTDIVELRQVLTDIPYKEMYYAVAKKYREMYYRNLNAVMQEELQTSEYHEMLAIIGGKPSKGENKGKPTQKQYDAWARRLHAAFAKYYSFIPGTDEDAIKAVFNEIPTKLDFYRVRVAYKRQYHTDLYSDLNGELEFWEYSEYMKIIKSKPKK